MYVPFFPLLDENNLKAKLHSKDEEKEKMLFMEQSSCEYDSNE